LTRCCAWCRPFNTPPCMARCAPLDGSPSQRVGSVCAFAQCRAHGATTGDQVRPSRTRSANEAPEPQAGGWSSLELVECGP
jgi:hypothetical protein